MTHLRIYYEILGGHVHASFWSGKTQLTTHGKNGELIFTLDEWYSFKDQMLRGPNAPEIQEGKSR